MKRKPLKSLHEKIFLSLFEQKSDRRLIKNSYSARSLFIFFFSWLMIRWQKKRANKFPRWMRGVFVSYWLEYLIHIHNSVRVFAHYISNSSSMSEDVFPAAV